MIYRQRMELIVIATMALPLLAHAGVGKFDGEDESNWTRARYSILVARIDEVVERKGTDPAGPETTTLVSATPRATIAGCFDCSEHPRIVLQCWPLLNSPGLDEVPPKGSLVLMVVCRLEGDDFYQITSSTCPLITGHHPVKVIQSMDDPEVGKTVERAQKARAIAKAKAEKEKRQREKRETGGKEK